MIPALSLIFSSRYHRMVYILLIVLLASIWWYSTDFAIMFGNYGYPYTIFDICLSWIMILGFPLFLIALFQRSLILGKRSVIKPKSGIGVLGGFFGILISGASCCGATLAASVGLLPVMTFLPYNGLEIKIVATIGLLYALWDILTHIDTCKIR